MNKRRRDEVTDEEVRKALELADQHRAMNEKYGMGWDALTLSALRDLIATKRKEYQMSGGSKRGSRLKSLDEILNDPQRVLRAGQMDDGEGMDRTIIVIDHATGEVLESRISPNLQNKMSMKYVEYVTMKPDAEKWLRSQVSGRILTSKGIITVGSR